MACLALVRERVTCSRAGTCEHLGLGINNMSSVGNATVMLSIQWMNTQDMGRSAIAVHMFDINLNLLVHHNPPAVCALFILPGMELHCPSL